MSLSFQFGTVGSPLNTPKKPGGSVGAIAYSKSIGLDTLELGWVQSVRVTEVTCAAIKGMAEEQEAPTIADLLATATRNYCSGVSNYQFASKTELADKCGFVPKCRDWVLAKRTDFIPFGHQDPTNKVVLFLRYGRNNARCYDFTKGQLSIRPE